MEELGGKRVSGALLLPLPLGGRESGGGGGGGSLGSLARSNSRGGDHPLFPGRAVPFPEGTREGAEVPAGRGPPGSPGGWRRWSL